MKKIKGKIKKTFVPSEFCQQKKKKTKKKKKKKKRKKSQVH